MARIKKIFNGTTFELTTPKSGNSLLNEKTRLIKQDAQQIRTPYITNGYNVDNLIIDTKYNDNNTRVFNSNLIDIDNILNVNDIATPSTTSNIDTVSANNTEIINKFSIKKNSIDTKFSAFIDREYISNNSLNQDFIKGEGQYQFLDSNLYEEVAIDIELDVPKDALLEYTAKMQEQDLSNIDSYTTTSYLKSPYNFRQTVNQKNRKNSSFLMYNFKEKCFESRGYYARTPNEAQAYEGATLGGYENIQIIPSMNFKIINNNNQIEDIVLHSAQNDGSAAKIFNFVDFFNKNVINHHIGLTNTPINQLKPEVNSFDLFNYLTLPTLQFGFPHFPTFHTFSENLLSLKKYLNKNLIVDRITVDLNVKVQAETSTDQDLEDIDIRDGLNFSLNYFILNDNNNKKDLGNSFLLLKSQKYFNDFRLNDSDLTNPSNFLSYFFATTHFSTLTYNKLPSPTQNILNSSKQNLKIQRKFWKENELLVLTDMTNNLNDINFNKNIVTFGNVLFHASNKAFILNVTQDSQGKKVNYSASKLSRITLMQNNNDLLIDTIADNVSKSSMMNTTADISDSFIFLDFEDKIKINSYIKKSSGLTNSATINNTFLNSNNLNYQIEFKSVLDSTSQYSLFNEASEYNIFNGKGFLIEKTNSQTRNLLNNRLDGKDLLNAQSTLSLEKDRRIFPRKTSKSLFKNLKKEDNSSFSSTDTTYYYNNYQASDSTNLSIKRESNFSPYVLTPDDNLAFCFSISPTISPKLFKHSCAIKQGKVKFTLYGYMKKNNDKIQDYNLKNLNQTNLGNMVIGNDLVIDDYSNTGYLSGYISTFYDRIFEGTFNLNPIPESNNNPISRKLDDTTATSFSKILSGKSYIPYLKLFANNNVLNDEFIYDDRETYTYLIQKIISSNISNLDPYKVYTIAKELSFYKNQKSEEELANNIQNNTNINTLKTSDQIYSVPGPYENQTYADIYNSIITDLTNSGVNALVAAILALIPFAALVSADAIWDLLINGDKRYLNSYVNSKRYGQYNNFIEQRPYTTVKNATGKIDYVIEQNFINVDTGIEITNLNNVMTRNKSKYLNLIDAGYKSITNDGVITPWDGTDFYNRVHVSFNDSAS